MPWSNETSPNNASWLIRWEIVQYTRGLGLDLGCGCYNPIDGFLGKPFQHFIGIDSLKDQKVKNGIDIVTDAFSLPMVASQSMDFVFSSHLLEHAEKPGNVLVEWWRLIKPGGHLVLYLPHKDFYPNSGQPGANPDHKHDLAPADVVKYMEGVVGGWELLENQERGEGVEFSFLQVYKKLSSLQRLFSYQNPKPEKRAAVVRYGGYGDMIQASSVLPWLKEQGYHVTLYTTPVGKQVLQHDPHVDAFYVQDSGQVPNQDLPAFWDWEKKKYDKWINLSGSVEGAFLSTEGAASHQWPHELRHWMMDKNYLEFTHMLGGVPMPPRHTFYPSSKEPAWAAREKKKIGGNGKHVVMWVLSGSSPHKTWPYMDSVIANLLLKHGDGIRIVLVGDELCQMLETGWENEPRVVLRSGKWSIRETMAFASSEVDLVIGPETGVMFAVALDKTPKVIFLSHASENNLTRDWVNCKALFPSNKDCPCYPCHMLHHTFKYCTRDEETGTALCQARIHPARVVRAITEALGQHNAGYREAV